MCHYAFLIKIRVQILLASFAYCWKTARVPFSSSGSACAVGVSIMELWGWLQENGASGWLWLADDSGLNKSEHCSQGPLAKESLWIINQTINLHYKDGWDKTGLWAHYRLMWHASCYSVWLEGCISMPLQLQFQNTRAFNADGACPSRNRGVGLFPKTALTFKTSPALKGQCWGRTL